MPRKHGNLRSRKRAGRIRRQREARDKRINAQIDAWLEQQRKLWTASNAVAGLLFGRLFRTFAV